jgi:predicted alpha/beta-hydrolase family hydrolase
MVADELGVTGLVCLGYPFHPPGRPEQPRVAQLAELRTPALIVQGTRDPFGSPDEIADYDLSRWIGIHFLEDGDHDLRPRKAVSGRTAKQNMDEAVTAVAAFVRGML